MLISDKTDFRANESTRGRKGHCIMMTRALIYQEDTANINTKKTRCRINETKANKAKKIFKSTNKVGDDIPISSLIELTSKSARVEKN